MVKMSKLLREIRAVDATYLVEQLHVQLGRTSLNDEHILMIRAELEKLMAGLKLQYHKQRYKSTLKQADAERDQCYRGLLYLNKGYIHHPDKGLSAAAQQVQQVLDKYGFGLVKKNYATQSTLIDALLRQLMQADTAPMIAQLSGMSELLEQLDKAQRNFESAERQWHKARVEESKTPSATVLKYDLIQLVNHKLVMYLRAMLHINPESYQVLYNRVARSIKQANDAVHRRKSSTTMS